MLPGLRKERDALEKELQKLSVYRKFLAIQATIRAYEEALPDGSASPHPRARAQISATRKAIREACYAFLDGQAEPVRSAMLIPHLEQQGLELGEGDTVSKLSALLGQDERFKSFGRRGWKRATLEEQEAQRQARSEAAAPFEDDDPS